MKTTIIVTSVAAALIAPATKAQLVVAAPGVEARQDVKNIFDQIKYHGSRPNGRTSSPRFTPR
jgi:hypothetical protein